MSYKIEGKKISFSTTECIEFDFPISKVLEFDNKILVLLDVLDGIFNRNVFAISNLGDFLWQIQKSKELDAIGNCPFTSFDIRNGNLSLFNWCGFRFTVDIDTGEIMSSIFTK
jgi:hypothetical protein